MRKKGERVQGNSCMLEVTVLFREKNLDYMNIFPATASGL